MDPLLLPLLSSPSPPLSPVSLLFRSSLSSFLSLPHTLWEDSVSLVAGLWQGFRSGPLIQDAPELCPEKNDTKLSTFLKKSQNGLVPNRVCVCACVRACSCVFVLGYVG